MIFQCNASPPQSRARYNLRFMEPESVRGVLESSRASIGSLAPEFELPALIGGVRKQFRLADYRGKTLVLAFYPFNWQDASLRQMAAYQSERARILAAGVETVAINVESIMNTTAWERANGPFDFPLCSDFWPHGAVSKQYNVLRESGAGAGASERAIFALNPQGLITFCRVYGPEETPVLEDVISLGEKA
jgi:mycoredoxin-dependent peroxiredoxin